MSSAVSASVVSSSCDKSRYELIRDDIIAERNAQLKAMGFFEDFALLKSGMKPKKTSRGKKNSPETKEKYERGWVRRSERIFLSSPDVAKGQSSSSSKLISAAVVKDVIEKLTSVYQEQNNPHADVGLNEEGEECGRKVSVDDSFISSELDCPNKNANLMEIESDADSIEIFTDDSDDDVATINQRLPCVSEDDIKKAPRKEKIWVCKTCGKGFVKSLSLKVHEIKGHNPPVFKCDFGGCDFATCHKGGLFSHRLKHSNYFSKKIKNLRCSECDFVTWHQGVLVCHKKIHSEQETMKCSERDFVVTGNKGTMSRHKKKHSLSLQKKKQDHIKCSECDFVSPTSYHLKKHKIFVHNIGKLNCEDCNFFTIQIGDLRKHRRKNHPEKLATDTISTVTK